MMYRYLNLHYRVCAPDLFTLMMGSVARNTLSQASISGKDNSQTAIDHLMGDGIFYLRSKGLGFPVDLKDSGGL